MNSYTLKFNNAVDDVEWKKQMLESVKIIIAIFVSIQTVGTMYRFRNYEIGLELEVNIRRAVVNVI